MSSIKIPDFSFLNKETIRNKSNNKYNYISTLGMLTSFFIILLIFILLKINNIWILIGFFILADLTLLWHSISTKKSILPTIILLFVGTAIILWQYRYKIFYNQENFYTLFKPYQPYPGEQPFSTNINTVALSNTTTNLLKYRVKPINFGYQIVDNKIASIIGKLLLSKAKISNINLISQKSPENICSQVNNNILTLALIQAPIVNRCYTENKMSNLQFVANVQHQYLFCISSIKSGVQNIHQLRRRRVGIPPRLKSIWLDIEPFIFPEGNSIKFVFDNEYNLIKDIANFKIDAFFYAGEYPNQFLNTILNTNGGPQAYQLVPIMLGNEKEFLFKNKAYRKNILKLTYDYLPSSYLPSGLGRMWQSNYTPDFLTFGFDLSLICNSKLDNFTGYEIAKTIFYGRKVIVRNTSKSPYVYIGDPFTSADITNPSLPNLPVQKGSKNFYVSKGLISYCGDPKCMITIGNNRCSYCDKGKSLTNMKWNDMVITEKILGLYQ
jgi:TRAP-type uncharacterized transport system substrate-binding protein